MTTERERESQRLGLAYNNLARALAFALDVVLPVDTKHCDECGPGLTNHDGESHRAAEARMERTEP